MTPVVLKGGVSVDWDVVRVLLGIEDRGGVFHVQHSAVSVQPSGVLTRDERATLVAHKPEVLRILAYDAEAR